MQLRFGYIAQRSNFCNHLPLFYHLPPADKYFRVVPVSRYPAARMADQDQVAESLEFIADIDNCSGICSLDGRTSRRGNIDPVIVQPALLGPIM